MSIVHAWVSRRAGHARAGDDAGILVWGLQRGIPSDGRLRRMGSGRGVPPAEIFVVFA